MALLFCHISSGNYQLFRRGKGKQLYVSFLTFFSMEPLNILRLGAPILLPCEHG